MHMWPPEAELAAATSQGSMRFWANSLCRAGCRDPVDPPTTACITDTLLGLE